MNAQRHDNWNCNEKRPYDHISVAYVVIARLPAASCVSIRPTDEVLEYEKLREIRSPWPGS